MLTADIGIASDWITIGFPTSNGGGNRRLGQIDMFVLALRGEKHSWSVCEWNGVTCVKLLLVIESWLFRGEHNFIMTHLSSRIPSIKDTEILGGW